MPVTRYRCAQQVWTLVKAIVKNIMMNIDSDVKMKDYIKDWNKLNLSLIEINSKKKENKIKNISMPSPSSDSEDSNLPEPMSK